MPLLLVDALEPAEAAALRAHLATGCTRCASYLAEADATLAYLPFALDQTAPAPSARDRLFNQLNQAPPSRPDTTPARRHILKLPHWVRDSLPAAIAASIVFIATVQTMLYLQRNREAGMTAELSDLRQTLNVARQHNSELTDQVQLVRLLTGSSKQITLEGKGQPKAFGRAFWDDNRKAWYFRAFNLEQLPKNEGYQLWFETPYGHKIPTPRTFKPDEHGDAYIVVTLPADSGPVSKAFVTDEPSVGTYQPTGAVHLYGKIKLD
jgi:hypothetical protein